MHMGPGSHSVNCHPAEIWIPALPPAEAGTRFSDHGVVSDVVEKTSTRRRSRIPCVVVEKITTRRREGVGVVVEKN